MCPRGQKWPPMAHATHSPPFGCNLFLSLAAAADDVVVVGTDVVSCLLLSINAGRRFSSATAAGGCGDGCFLIFQTSSWSVPKQK